MAKLYLLRHLKSKWNQENRFTGWVDVPLADEGREQAEEIAGMIGSDIDVIFVSELIRAQETLLRVFEYLPEKYPLFVHREGGMKKWGHFEGEGHNIPAHIAAELNERYYGDLQGLNKEEAAEKFGKEQVHIWRRSYDIQPPNGESLKDVCARATPFYQKEIEGKLKEGKNVLVVASGNSLRAIIKYIDNIPDDKIIDFELGFGALVKYDFEGETYTKLQ
jgi:2,3-bisphosphoglycerate-dependent phosphoglycerate mutase